MNWGKGAFVLPVFFDFFVFLIWKSPIVGFVLNLKFLVDFGGLGVAWLFLV